jgi:Putative addiction module component
MERAGLSDIDGEAAKGAVTETGVEGINKVRTMETIWKSLSANPEAIESPAWHEEELRVREAQIASGEAKFVDWDRAKAEIRRQTS